MEPVKCFFLEPQAIGRVSLRRYTFSSDKVCPGSSAQGGHNACVQLGIEPYPPGHNGEQRHTISQDDPQWPAKCENCSYWFEPEDQWQEMIHRCYGEDLWTLTDAPVGAMWYADWYPWKGPDGLCLCLRTPGGDWLIDAPSTSGAPWQRSGTPPNITASPSIDFPGRFHGWLRNGILTEC